MPPRSAMARIVVPFMSPVSLKARRAALRIELRRASAVRRRARGGSAVAVACFGMASPGRVEVSERALPTVGSPDVKVAVAYDAGAPLVLEDLPEPAVGPRDVRVRIAASGICHTDLNVIEGRS